MGKKRNGKESMICLTPKPRKSFFVYHIQSKEKLFFFFFFFFTEKELFKEKGGWKIQQKNEKRAF